MKEFPVKKLSVLLILFTILMGYGFYSLFHNEPSIKPSNESSLEDTQEHVHKLRSAFTGNWILPKNKPITKPGQIQIAKTNLLNPIIQNKPLENAKTEKTEKKKTDKKKKTADKKKPSKYERYVSRKPLDRDNFEKPKSSIVASTQFQNPPPPPLTQPNKVKTVADWVTLITTPISTENLNSLILSYQARTLGAPVFYGVIDKLINSKKPEIQQLAIKALSATPSAASFERLVELSKDPKSKEALAAYKKVNNLSILNQVLSSKVTGVQSTALTLIQEVASEAVANQPQGDDSTTYTQAQQQQIVQVFSQSLRILQTILASSPNNPNPLLQQTIVTLQNLLKA